MSRPDQVTQHVAGLPENRDRLRPHGDITISHVVENGFKSVRKLDQEFQMKGPGPALDGMHGPKNTVYLLAVLRLDFRKAKVFLQTGKKVFAFFKKGDQYLVQITAHMAFP